MRKGFLIYQEMPRYFPIYEEAVSHIWLCNCSTLNFPIYEESLIFFFISELAIVLFCFVSHCVYRELDPLPPPTHVFPPLRFPPWFEYAWGAVSWRTARDRLFLLLDAAVWCVCVHVCKRRDDEFARFTICTMNILGAMHKQFDTFFGSGLFSTTKTKVDRGFPFNPHQNDQGRKGPCYFQRLNALKCLKGQKI
jgi:hypothetical protein